MDDVGPDFGQGDENKTSLVEPGMGDGEVLVRHDPGTVQKQVQVHGARPLDYGPAAAEHLRLDPLELGKQEASQVSMITLVGWPPVPPGMMLGMWVIG